MMVKCSNSVYLTSFYHRSITAEIARILKEKGNIKSLEVMDTNIIPAYPLHLMTHSNAVSRFPFQLILWSIYAPEVPDHPELSWQVPVHSLDHMNDIESLVFRSILEPVLKSIPDVIFPRKSGHNEELVLG